MDAEVGVGLLTVEEVAAASGRSVQTIRRLCAAGQIPAVKSGRQWLVLADRLPPIRPVRPVRRAEGIDLTVALDHLRATDHKDPWVPDVLNHEDLYADRDSIEAEASARVSARGPFDPLSEVEIPKTPVFTRTAHLLSIEDHVAYQAVVGSVADRIDRQLPSGVYSARLSEDPGEFTLDGRQQWLAWMEELAVTILGGQTWMLKTDLTAYFDTIHHKRLSEDLRAINASSDAVAALERMLGDWSQHRGYGLPQGPNASRVLANLYLAPIDHVMTEADCHYSRYVDDIRIIGRSRPEVLRAFRQLNRECKRRGLILSQAKTKILEGQAALEDCFDKELDDIQYLWQARRVAQARDKLRRVWERALNAEGELDTRHAKFSLWRLGLLRDTRPVHKILQTLEYLAPAAREVAIYLKPWMGRPRVQDGLSAFLFDGDRNTSPYLSAWLLAAVTDRPERPADAVARYARRVAALRNEPEYHRVLALGVVGRSGQVLDVNLLRDIAASEYDPVVLRGALVGMARAGILDKGTARAVVRRAPVLERTVRYLAGRSSLPQLLNRARRMDIDG